MAYLRTVRLRTVPTTTTTEEPAQDLNQSSVARLLGTAVSTDLIGATPCENFRALLAAGYTAIILVTLFGNLVFLIRQSRGAKKQLTTVQRSCVDLSLPVVTTIGALTYIPNIISLQQGEWIFDIASCRAVVTVQLFCGFFAILASLVGVLDRTLLSMGRHTMVKILLITICSAILTSPCPAGTAPACSIGGMISGIDIRASNLYLIVVTAIVLVAVLSSVFLYACYPGHRPKHAKQGLLLEPKQYHTSESPRVYCTDLVYILCWIPYVCVSAATFFVPELQLGDHVAFFVTILAHGYTAVCALQIAIAKPQFEGSPDIELELFSVNCHRSSQVI